MNRRKKRARKIARDLETERVLKSSYLRRPRVSESDEERVCSWDQFTISGDGFGLIECGVSSLDLGDCANDPFIPADSPARPECKPERLP